MQNFIKNSQIMCCINREEIATYVDVQNILQTVYKSLFNDVSTVLQALNFEDIII